MPQKAVATHRMSPELYDRLKCRAYYYDLSLNRMYDVIMQALVDRKLFYCNDIGEFTLVNNEQYQNKAERKKALQAEQEKKRIVADMACKEFNDQLKGESTV